MELTLYRPKFDYNKSTLLLLLVLTEVIVGLTALIFPWKFVILCAILIPIVPFLLHNPKHAYYLGILLMTFWTITFTGKKQVMGVPEFRWADAAFIIAAMGFIYRGLAGRNLTFQKSGIEIPLFVLFLWMGLSFFWSPSFSASSIEFIRKSYGLTIFYLTLNFVGNRSDLDKVIKVWIVAALVAALFGLYELFSEGLKAALQVIKQGEVTVWGRAVRSSAFFITPNKLGLFLNIGIILGLCQYVRTRNRLYKKFIVLSEVILFGALICTLSRTSWVTLTLGCLFLSAASPRIRKFVVLNFFVAIILFLVLTSSSYRSLTFQRLFGVFEPVTTLSLIQRTEIWKAGVHIITSHPITGIGIGNYPSAVKSYGIPEALSAPHNLYFYLVAEFGIIGLGLFLVLVVAIISTILSKLKVMPYEDEKIILLTLFTGVILVLIQSMITSYVLREVEIWVFLGITMAAARILSSPNSIGRVDSTTAENPKAS